MSIDLAPFVAEPALPAEVSHQPATTSATAGPNPNPNPNPNPDIKVSHQPATTSTTAGSEGGSAASASAASTEGRDSSTEGRDSSTEGRDSSTEGRDSSTEGGTLVYDCVGAMLHAGSAQGGHYTALLRSGVGAGWHEFNDGNVSVATGADVASAAGERVRGER